MVYLSQFYHGLSEEDIRKNAIFEGFDPLVIRNNPGDQYPPHAYAQTKLLAILFGSMRVRVDDKRYTYKIIIPGNIEHEAVVGKQGCRFFWSEKL